MVEKKNIVFLIHTEFHLIEAISYIFNNYLSSGYQVYVYRIATSNSRRLDKYNIQVDEIPGTYRVVRYDAGYMFSRSLKDALNEIVSLNPEKMVFFDEGQFWLPYLMRKLKRNGCVICMAPDGANVYSADKLTFEYLYKYIIHSFLFIYSHWLIPPLWPIIRRHHYGYSKYIDELWMEHSDCFVNYYKRKVCIQPVYNTDEIRDCVNRVFGLRDLPADFPKGKSIVFFDAPLSDAIIDRCQQLLINIMQRYPEYKVYIKMHPHSTEYSKELYEKIPGVSFMPNVFPAELYIQNMTDSVFLSAYSNCLFSYNPSCLYFWIYPMFKELLPNEVLINPTDYIHEVSDLSELFNQIESFKK